MKPVKASVNHDPANGTYGDCFRAVFASIFELQRDNVPHFFIDGSLENATERLDEWLARAGLTYVETAYPADGFVNAKEFIKTACATYPGFFLIIGGSTNNGVNHVVIARDGETVHDPAVNGSGLAGPNSLGCYSIGFIVSAVHVHND